MQAESRADSALMDTNPGIAARPEFTRTVEGRETQELAAMLGWKEPQGPCGTEQ